MPIGLKGENTWLCLTERWTATAKSVFLFDVQGSVAKSTFAGLPWPFPSQEIYIHSHSPIAKIRGMDSTTIIRIVAGLIFVFVMLPVVVIPYWKIFSKAGFSGWLSLLILFPLVNLIVLYIVAFSEWKTIPKPESINSQLG